MKCPACGNDELREHHRFCCNCGCSLSGVQSARETLTGPWNNSERTPAHNADEQTAASNSENTRVNFASERHPRDQLFIDANQHPDEDKSTEGDKQKRDSQNDGSTSREFTVGSLPISNSKSNFQQAPSNTGILVITPDRLDKEGFAITKSSGRQKEDSEPGEEMKNTTHGSVEQEDKKGHVADMEAKGNQTDAKEEQQGQEDAKNGQRVQEYHREGRKQHQHNQEGQKVEEDAREVPKGQDTPEKEQKQRQNANDVQRGQEYTNGVRRGQEGIKEKQTGQKNAKEKWAGQEDANEKRTGQEDAKEEWAGQEDAKEKQAGQEDAKEKLTGQEDAKEEWAGQEDAKETLTVREDAKKKLAGEEDSKEKQAGKEEIKERLTGQEGAKQNLAGQEDAKKKLAEQENIKGKQAGQDDIMKKQVGQGDSKEKLTEQEDAKEKLAEQEDAKVKQVGQEAVKEKQAEQEDAKTKMTGQEAAKEKLAEQEDVKVKQVGQEDDKKKQAEQADAKQKLTVQKDVKEKQAGHEDAKEKQTGQEDAKQKLTGQEDGKEKQAEQADAKENLTGQEDVKEKQAKQADAKQNLTGQEDAKEKQTGKEDAKQNLTGQEDAKEKQTGQEDAKEKQTGKEDAKEKQTEQADAKENLTGQENAKQKQTGQEDAKEKQTGKEDAKQKLTGQEDAKQKQAGQEDAKQKQSGQEDAKQKQTGQEDAKENLIGQEDAKEKQAEQEDDKGKQAGQENAKERLTGHEDAKEKQAGQENAKKKQTGQEDPKKEQENTREKLTGREDARHDSVDSNRHPKDPKSEYVTVVFHALLTPTFQFNPIQGDRLYIRGGLPFSWNAQNQLAVQVAREVFNGYLELKSTIKMTLEQASRKIAYKYVVVRPQGYGKPPKNLWECLVDFKPRVSGHVNRCLHIRDDSLKGNATWHQYDDALFSEPGFWESICSHFPLLRMVQLDPAEGRRMAMLVMLPEWDRISCNEGGISASSALTTIHDVVYCFSKPEVENGGHFFDRFLTNFKVREVLYEYLSPRLNLNTQIQQTHAVEDEIQVKRLVTSVIIASLSVRHEMTFMTGEELRNLLENLALRGNADKTRCAEIEGLLQHFSKEHQLKTLADFMRRLCNYVIEHRSGMSSWLFVVPLLHFLSKSSAPYCQKMLTPAPSSVKDDSWWGIEDLNLRKVRERPSTTSNSPGLLLSQLLPMLELDPLFKRTFLLALPIDDISKILKKRQFSLHEVCWTLNRVVEERRTPFLNDDEWDCLEDCVKEMNDDAEKYDRLQYISQWEEMTSLAKATSQLLQHLLTQYQLAIRKRSVVLCGLLALLGNSLVLAKQGYSVFQSGSTPFNERPEEVMNIFNTAFFCLQESLKKHFGRKLLDASEEFQFWSNLLSVKFEDKEIQQCFETGIKELLESRISEVDHRHVVELFCTLDLSIYKQDVGDCVMSAAFNAVDYLLKSENKEHVASLSSRLDSAKLTYWQASGVSRLFGLLLKRYWPVGSDGKEPSQDEILLHIFSWKPMAQYFEYFGHPQDGVTLPDDSMVLLGSSSSLLEDVGRRLKNAEIDVKTLRIVQKNRKEFLKLHYLLSEAEESQSSKDVKTGENKMSETDEKQQGTRCMELFLEMRIEELKAFEKERDAVSCFVESCSVIKSVEIDLKEIKEKLESNMDSCRLLEICHKRSTSEEPIVIFFELSQKNRRMIQSFHLVRSSLLFYSFWQECIDRVAELCRDEYGSTEVLGIDKVNESLWKPSIQRWRGMWEGILGGEISLKKVEDRFGRFRNDPESLHAETDIVLKFFRDEEDIEDDLSRAVAQIKQFQKLTECEDAAAAILDFQKAMKLKGDFQVLNDFRDQLNEDFCRRPLDSIDDEVLAMGKVLERLTRPMIDCLGTVTNCREYIFWLREEVKGREEVKTLVDLAMMSAGESDIETDRVSCLHTTALSFAPFIFDLDKCADLSKLMAICESVSEEIKENETLPEKLRDISRHLEWLKGVKDAHAMSSLKLAQAINERGVYSIGQLENVASTPSPSGKKTIDSVISLLLLPATQDGEQFKVFSLEKLQELQSKLALISGKGSQGQDDVVKFSQLLQGVIQLGQTYVSLCEIGDVSHLDWNQEFKCKSKVGKKDVIDEIESKSQEFERCLKDCKEHINNMRMKYHELNYFTIQQLLFLRKELAKLKHGSTMNSLNLQVYALLEKVTPGLHQLNLRDALSDAGILTPYLDQDNFRDDAGSSSAGDLMSVSSQEKDDLVTDDQQIVKEYEQLLSYLEKINPSEPERLAVAALVTNLEGTEVDRILWCVQNNGNSDLIDELYDEASGDPRFRDIVSQAAESDEESSQSSQDSEGSHKSLTEDSDNEELDESIHEEIMLDETRGGTYLSLDEIGVFLSRLASIGERDARRRFPGFLKKGRPNLILTPKEYIFAAVLVLYMDEEAQCLPNSDEVLICTPETTSEEVELLWRRALASNGRKLYCLVNGDLLDYDVSQKAVDCLHTLVYDYPNNEGLSLVVLCSSENEERAHIVTSLEQYKVEGIPRHPRPDELRRYLEKQFKAPHQRPGSYHEQHVIWSAAAEVGRAEDLNVHVVTSEHPGVGKSLVVQRLAEQVKNLPNNLLIAEVMESQLEEPPPLCVTIPFHDKHARVGDVVGFFLPHAISSEVPLSRIFHLDRSSSVTPELETLLFNLLILGELTDDRGRVWRRNPYDLYILEITDPTPKEQTKTPEMCKFHELLPSIICFLPKESLKFLHRKRAAQRNRGPLFDEEELQSESVQRVWQYLQLFNEHPQLIQEFTFDARSIRGDSPAECLETLIRNCGVRNPSWSELRYFVNFLNYQLRDCENSAYCDISLIEDTLEGFRSFVVAFMIIMSKDFSMRSLKERDSLGNEQSAADVDEERDIAPFQLRRQWEKSPHPYIFFNPDHVTMTFLGFRVDQDGNLLDPRTGEIIQEGLMSRHLRTGLHVQRVDLNNDFESYSKADMINLLCSVMGIECGYDPDESYELTGDNVKKILAIHMRFRCNIPVIIMGETGCGKTRLIRYLCGLQTEGEWKELKNMLLMKIHGGTTYKDIERNVLHAEAMALQNEQRKKHVDTVLFFDEANTTDALGMIKEIMVDRRCNGRPLSDRLKFIVACNPYRRHTVEMIQRLESAGLGYHVRADETEERLGRIPLRHLVYRVHALPESMRSLVWDFGQLNPEVEELYTRQIVGRYVQQGRFPGDETLVIAIATVLAASQQFMRKKKDECSFVSLRDVKRAMEVMVWFYENSTKFSSLIEDEERKNDVVENVDDSEGESEEEQTTFVKQLPAVTERRTVFIESPAFVEERRVKRAMEVMEERPMFPEREPQKARIPDFAEFGEMFEHEHPSQLPLAEELLDVVSQEAPVSDDIDRITWSLILALGVCYQARLRDRDEYREAVAKSFHRPCRLPGGAERIEKEISRCQQALMAQMKLGPNIARNAALSENVFMMVVCIELRIPLFVVGKPGSSKSLAKTVVADNMQGENSTSELFKTFKQIQLVSYQCSPQSTPEGILATFKQCRELQKSKNTERTSDRFASVVVLDEVGLAEDSPKMPLKTLHPLLEDENEDDIIQTEDSFTRVAFIGLSNWALDPAKMNRGIMLCRNEPDGNELEATARGICGGDEDVMALIEPLISPLVRGYTELYNKQKNLEKLQKGNKDEFFGLRDFYSLLKMVVHIAKEQMRPPNWQELERAIKRNFSGLLEDDFNPVQIIMRNVGFPSDYFQEEEEHRDEDSLNLIRGEDSLNLIRASLDQKGVMGEGRYLLIMSENFAALPRVKQLLMEKDSEEPYVIFGSGFPKDQLFTQVCRNINRVKICMETGRTVILLNLENLYESLYDALNQYYVTFGGEKYVDLGLGNNRVKCRVHKNFRLIVIAEKDVVYNKFPIPLINRLEKHFLVMSSGLTEPQKQLTKKLKSWVKDYAEIFQQDYERPKRKFKTGDAFIGYHEDSVPAVVLQVCAELHDDGSVLSDEDRQSWEENVLRCCQECLLQCATPDSVTRLRRSRLSSQAGDLWTTYFRDQEHSSLVNFLDKAVNDAKSRTTGSAKITLRAQISTHSRLLSDRDIPDIAAAVGLSEGCVKCVSLQQFQTEQQFCNCIGRDFWARLGGEESLLIVQCDSADQNLGLVACSRHLLIEECREMEEELDHDSIGPSHILMIVQLSRVAGGCSDFVGVQVDDWQSIHIDELRPPREEMPPIEALTGRSVSTIFESALHKTEPNLTVSQVLASCVQEAASRIEDDETTVKRATRRIELLLKLLSSKTGDERFELVLAERLCKLLQEKDQRATNEGNEWLQSEALSRTLNETGTFKKALWRRFQSVVAPILAEVIAYVDRDGNLELAASEHTWVFNLWLRAFRDSSLTELSYESFHEGVVPVVRTKVPVSKSGYRSHAFQCRFPFSWLLKERIDELYRDARSIAANSRESVTECLRRLLNNSEVKSIVSEAIIEGGQELVVACYLHDFVHMVYKPHDEDELEVVQKAIKATAKEIHNSVQAPGEMFAMDLALVHVAHSRVLQRLNCLSLLLLAKADIVPDLQNKFSWDENEMTVDAMALQMCLERMEPCPEDVENTSRRQAWCDQVLSVKVPVEETISNSSPVENARVGEKTELILTQCRCMWQRLSAVRMFIEHVCPSQVQLDHQDIQNILKLWKALGDRTDFSKAGSLITVERFLVSCSEDSIQRLQADKPEDHEKFLHRCNAFFMDIVSVFCFGEDVRFLDPEVFEMLMRFVTGAQSTRETKEFSPFPEFGADSSPVVRSFLLQQLINSSDEKAKKHLKRFLYEAQGLSSEVPHILNVCLLAVQCMENSYASTLAKNANLDLQLSIGIITKFCQDALQILNKDFASSDELQVESLDAIAKARYALGMTAEFLYLSCVSDDDKWRKHETRSALEHLFVKVKALCTSGNSRSPALYLLKQLVKRYGGHSIATVCQNEELSWIVPDEFQQREGEGMNLDRFLVYGELYRKVRDYLARAILSENTDELVAILEDLREIPRHARDIVILMALYREVAVTQNQQFPHRKCSMIEDVVLKRGRFLSTNARHFAKDLLKNSQGLGSPFIPVQETQSEIQKALPEILFHVTAVLRCTEFDEMLEPLRRIMLTPDDMMGSFLPTMPEDSFTEITLSMSEGGSWYECPAGHRYFVGDCGRPDQTRDCPWCESGVAIGGEKHHLVQTNRLATKHDRSNTGHILGVAQQTIAERDLSPANVSLLRVILHSAMLIGAYQQPEVVSQLMKPEVPAGDICGFLWEHLVNDVRNVSISLERSEDEVLLMIHLVLSEIMSRSTMRGLDYNEKWSTKTGRKEWENDFVNVFARHVCTNLEERLQNFYSLSVNDRRLGNDPLMKEIYEVDTTPPTRTAADIHPGHAAFWKYRTRVTVEHVIRQFQDVKSNVATCKVLGKFFAEARSLRAVRHLPDILALHRMLTDRLHRRIDRDKANQLKIREFLQELPKGQKENVTKLFRSFSAAWDHVRLQLSSQGRFAPTKEQCSQPIEQNSTVSVLLPEDAGAGACCKGLLFFLVNSHNELVQTYYNAVNSNGSARTAGEIPLSEVSVSQLIVYDSEKDLLPVMLANCSYSLEVGKETQLQYNWETLEKQIVDRFLRGRPLVGFEVDNFVFREDARDDFSFDRLRSKIPQEPIPGSIRAQILSELKDLRDVCDLLSTLEMAVGFLSAAGGNPEMKINDYFKTVLLLPDGKSNLKSKTAKQSCSLNHILDLWSTLAVARAKLLIKNGEDPFEEVPEIFKTEMSRQITIHFSSALKKVNIESFLSKVIQVIGLLRIQEEEQPGEMGLGEYLSRYAGDYPDADEIPEEVCVKHVIYAWQLAMENWERDQRRRRSMLS